MRKDADFIFQRIPAPLISWYRTHKRDLPWRDNPTPYRVWVSEIMLQQTRVEAVKEYYYRFMTALPTVEDLAICEEEKLLKLWEGLGYYSRARNMQKAAKIVVAEYGGELPKDTKALLTLPGIGSYTAGAIASIAYGQPVAAVDGNVFRVAARLTEDGRLISDPAYRKYLEKALTAVYPLPGKECGEFTQSLFELGATVCKPQTPVCENCPLQQLCFAYAHGTQGQYPVMPIKKAQRVQQLYVFLIQTPHGFCIRRREEGVLRGMNEFPSHVIVDGEMPENVLNEWGMYEFTEIRRKNYTHVFTHIRWYMTCIWLKTDSAPFDTYAYDEIVETVSLPTAFKQCMGLLQPEHEQLRWDV